jgi:hypothetical protein
VSPQDRNNGYVRDWCFDNRLLLNASKTKIMVFGSRQMILKVPDFICRYWVRNLFQSNQQKISELNLIQSFPSTVMLLRLVSSCISCLAQINSSKHFLDKNVLILVIIILVFNKLYYCSSVWANITANNIRIPQAVQNIAIAIITKSIKFDHLTPLLNDRTALDSR